jgi:hypothetical protein
MDQRPLPRARAHRRLASGRCGGLGYRTRGGGGKGEHGGPGSGLTRAQKVVKRRRVGDERGDVESSGAGHSGLENGQGGAVGGGDAEAPFYRVRGGVGRPDIRGERVAAVVRHNGGGGGCSRRGSARWWWGVMRGGGAPAVTGAEWVPGGGGGGGC